MQTFYKSCYLPNRDAAQPIDLRTGRLRDLVRLGKNADPAQVIGSRLAAVLPRKVNEVQDL